MTSTALTLLLLAGVLTMVVGSRMSYSKAQQLGEMEEEGRYALNLLQQDLRMAGFSGCSAKGTQQGSTWHRPQLHWNFAGGSIKGFDADSRTEWPSELLTMLGSALDHDSDVLVAQVPIGLPVTLRSSMSAEDTSLQVDSNAGLTSGDVVLVSDCTFRSYFEVVAVEQGLVSYRALRPDHLSDAPIQALGHAYEAGNELTLIDTQVYFIRESRDGTRGLWRLTGTRPPEQIGRGIKRMQLLFRVDNGLDDNSDAYLPANRIRQWREVRSVQVELVVATEDPTIESANSTKVFTAVVALRNPSQGIDR